MTGEVCDFLFFLLSSFLGLFFIKKSFGIVCMYVCLVCEFSCDVVFVCFYAGGFMGWVV
jgi:hypothetical protein